MAATTEEQPVREGRRARRRALVALASVAALGYAGWWWTHPDLFEAEGGGSFAADPLQFSGVTRVQHVGFNLPTRDPDADPESITIRDVRAEFSENTAGATASLVECTRRDVPGVPVVIGHGGDDDALREVCADVRSVQEGSRLVLERGYDAPRRYLVWRVEASRAGTWVLSGMEIDHRRSWAHLGRRGTEHVASDVRFTFG